MRGSGAGSEKAWVFQQLTRVNAGAVALGEDYYAIKFGPYAVNVHGGVHGGAIASAFDQAFSASLRGGSALVLRTSYARPCSLGEAYVVRVRTTRREGRTFFLEGHMYACDAGESCHVSALSIMLSPEPLIHPSAAPTTTRPEDLDVHGPAAPRVFGAFLEQLALEGWATRGETSPLPGDYPPGHFVRGTQTHRQWNVGLLCTSSSSQASSSPSSPSSFSSSSTPSSSSSYPRRSAQLTLFEAPSPPFPSAGSAPCGRMLYAVRFGPLCVRNAKGEVSGKMSAAALHPPRAPTNLNAP